MKNRKQSENIDSSGNLTEIALDWVIKHDRGLTDDEQVAFYELYEENLAFRESYKQVRKSWRIADTIPEDYAQSILDDIETSPAWYTQKWLLGGIAAAMLLVLSLFWFAEKERLSQELPVIAFKVPHTERLPDGSLVRLNYNTELVVEYTNDYRKINLLNGEAHFEVISNKLRPFIVEANDLEVVAVGTAFNVKLINDNVDVLVTEGVVRLDHPSKPLKIERQQTAGESIELPVESPDLLTAGQRAHVETVQSQPDVIVNVTGIVKDEIDSALSWQSSLLTLGGDTLEEISNSFEQKTGVKLIIQDAHLNNLRFGGKIPSNNVLQFLKALESNFGLHWEQLPNGDYLIGAP